MPKKLYYIRVYRYEYSEIPLSYVVFESQMIKIPNYSLAVFKPL